MKVYASRELCNELRKHETEEYARNRRYHRITIYSIILEKESREKSILFEIPHVRACDKVQACCSPRGRPRCFKAVSSRKIASSIIFPS